ncbi:MAG: menaquinone biosynthesis decarboxylase [Bacteroidota bacterium]
MAFKSLSHFVQTLEEEQELSRITAFVSPNLEIADVADRMVKNGGKALLFENNGTEFPLLINSYASDHRLCLALGVEKLDDIEDDLARLMKEFVGPRATFLEKLRILPSLQEVASWMPKTVRGRGACQEVIMAKPDLSKLPVPTCWPADGGPFITLPGVHTKDPVTGIRNLGMYRMQVFSPDMTGMHWHLHKGSAKHYQLYKELGRRMPVSVTLGGDPAYTYAATAPLPENLDEYLLAGFLRKKRVEMVRCLTNELEVPCDVDFVIEGYVDPAEELILEGPFGDHTGYYSLAGYFPRFHVTCITHRKNAIYPATIVGIPPQEDGWIGKATERIFLMPIKMTVAPEVTGMHMPVEGVFHNITLVSINKHYPGQAIKVMNSLWGAGQMMFNKIMAVVDSGVSLTGYLEFARVVSGRVDPLNDIHFMRGPVDILDHSSSRYAYGSKIGIDATLKVGEEQNPSSAISMPAATVQVGPLLARFQEVRAVNEKLLESGISLVIVALKKSKQQHVRYLAEDLLGRDYVKNVKFILFVDDVLDINSLSQVTWIAANNIDPMRDCFFVSMPAGGSYNTLCIDGTRKSLEFDDFHRDWPNVIVMDDRTIATVDAKWESLGLGTFIPSPSLVFKSLVTSQGAVSGEDF